MHIQQDDNQSLEDNIEMFQDIEFSDQIVLNGWFKMQDLKMN